MMRHALGVAYHGKHYHGWQIQSSDDSVQARVQSALTRFSQSPVKVICAGRTDRGVHASQQCIHFDSAVDRPSYSWVRGTNAFLPKDIRIIWHRVVDEAFHARFTATSRRYCYLFKQGMDQQVLWQDNAWVIAETLDICKMREACQYLLGTHDFSSFRTSQCQAHSPIRTLLNCEIIQVQNWLAIRVEANAFLHHMIRIMVYCLFQVGAGLQAPEWIKDLLLAKSRSAIDNMAPAQGLYFEGAKYPDQYDLPDFYTTMDLEGV